MDDTTSRQQIDELADLYLTTPGEDSGTPAPSPVEGPAPIKLAPKLGGETASTPDNPSAPTIDSTIDESDDSHPVLRLTEEASDNDSSEDEVPPEVSLMSEDSAAATLEPPTTPTEDTTNEPAPRAMLEAVLLGNLPGMSGPWLTQYAQLLAQTEGPVALLHVGEEGIDLELVEPRAEAEPAPAKPPATVRIPPMRGNRTGIVGLIDALVRSENAPTRTILVRIDAATDPQTLSRLAAIDDWTVLCGSDDTSIAGASQQLRSVVHADPRLADRNVGVMIMGSDEDASRSAAGRIAADLEYDLANPVELIGHLKRMQPVQVRDLGSFPDPVSIWPKLVSWFDTLELPEPMPTPEPAPPPVAAPQPIAAAPAQAAPQPTRQAPPASRPEPAPMFRQAPPTPAPAAPKPKQTARVAAPKPAPKPAAINPPMRPAPQPRVLTPQPELDLVALLAQGPAALDNAATLEARIPDQPDTQLAVDAEGTVHLLKQGSGVVSEDVMQLIEAGQWVTDHLELIALTQRDRDFVDTAPTLHLLTDQATQVTGKLAGQIKLHLLQQVTIGKETGWFCTPL